MKFSLARVLLSGLFFGLFSQVCHADGTPFVICKDLVDKTTGAPISSEIFDFTLDANQRPRNVDTIERLTADGMCQSLPIDMYRIDFSGTALQFIQVDNNAQTKDIRNIRIDFDSLESASAIAKEIALGRIKAVVFLDSNLTPDGPNDNPDYTPVFSTESNKTIVIY